MEANCGEPSCTLCQIREVLSCGVFTFHETHGFCGTLPSRVSNTQADDSAAQLPLLISKGSHHSAHNRSEAHTIYERKHITNLLPERVVSESKFLGRVVLPPMHGVYYWGHHFELPKHGRGCVSFTADHTSNDVHVAISMYPESFDPMYEIVVGGWANTTSVIRRRSQGPILCTVPVGLKKAAHADKNLWVSIDRNTQLIQVGRGSQPSLESLFCIYKDPQFLSKAQYICFSNNNDPATYSNIKVSAIE
ncbi:hypothetical protein KC19_12G159400 [Ceratodon purpureus]|uniref:Farnesoic acid O-methyl transferase domain-containing protein n=1 Tax=Ceratodon purpureus TaxID=3225 RepID=A0A8T0GBT7_CERPU|nr:hypothetical protein KC19_12G159400 [Ceratodon purpureus]